MERVALKIKEKVTNIVEMEITEERLKERVGKRKSWSSPGIDGIKNYRWKKITRVRKSVVASMNRWIDDPELIPTWITNGRTVLIPTEDLDNERHYRAITCMPKYLLQDLHRNGRYLHERTRKQKWDMGQKSTANILWSSWYRRSANSRQCYNGWSERVEKKPCSCILWLPEVLWHG